MSAEALDKALDLLREQSSTSREQGGYFEELCRIYLKYDPLHALDYSEVMSYGEWAQKYGARYEETETDAGVDLVAKLRDEEDKFVAIQCKFYQSDHKIDKPDLDKFLSASSKPWCEYRYFIDTTEVPWTSNAEETINNQIPPVYRINLNDLRKSAIDWQSYIETEDENDVRLKKKKIRKDQEQAIAAVTKGFATGDRGKMIMACGTGKTFTALKIAETIAGKGGRVLFLVPSLALISQAVREWKTDSGIDLRSFAVCSDSYVGTRTKKTDKSDAEDKIRMKTHELAFPSTTNAADIATHAKTPAPDEMIVVFSTYQSIQVINQAQGMGLPEFDLIICDEAHRTTGVKLTGDDESKFVKVHDKNFIKAKKRLYMTATPRIFGDKAHTKAKDLSLELCSMDDETLYGPVFHTLNFSNAVEAGLLSDYKVIVLAVDEGMVARNLQESLAKDNEIDMNSATRIVGCYKALAKQGDKIDFGGSLEPMRRAIAFCERIQSSKDIRDEFTNVIDEYFEQNELEKESKPNLNCEVRHVDGGFNAASRSALLHWLDAKAKDDECRILSNARCLSEGVDVPALDAVLFIHPRKSQIDVVQAVGRVMRRTKDKKLGYVILPVVIPAGVPPEEALKDNDRYRVIWDVLNALRSHDERLDGEINGMNPASNSDHIEVVAITDDLSIKKEEGDGDGSNVGKGKGGGEGPEGKGVTVPKSKTPTETGFDFPTAIRAKVVKKCGRRKYWENWAKDVGEIARKHTVRIKAILESDSKKRKLFDDFLEEVRDDLNKSITEDQAIEMLAQHLITKPIFDALFQNQDFTSKNPISKGMQQVIAMLESHNVQKEADALKDFYDSVRHRAKGNKTDESKQATILELYDKFFRLGFPETAERLGIAYTPVEVVDFINHSVSDILHQEFGETYGSKNVHILDPFTGTGTFITRLIQSEDLITTKELEYKFKNEIHANEIVLLAYYIAAINIETAYHGRIKGDYEPFEGICLTDTFELHEKDDMISKVMEDNSERRIRQKNLDIRVIIGNPPYNVGNIGVEYKKLNESIAKNYAEKTKATNKNSLYDSYIKAIRWASDRIGDRGVIGFVTNAGWLDGKAMDGMRESLHAEFTNIYVFNLRGNQRTSGDLSKREGGKIFGGGSRAPIAISLLVKNPNAKKHGQIFYHDIGEYLSREEKLEKINKLGSVIAMQEKSLWTPITPDKDNDWINQRDKSFNKHLKIGDKTGKSKDVLFANYTNGVQTARDAWCYNFGRKSLEANIQRTIDYFNSQVSAYSQAGHGAKPENFCKDNDKEIKWSPNLREALKKKKDITIEEGKFIQSVYRPFTKQWLHYHRQLNERVHRTSQIFPNISISNKIIVLTGVGERGGFDAMMCDAISDFHSLKTSQQFPLKLYEKANARDGELGLKKAQKSESDSITDYGLKYFQDIYEIRKITKEEIFYYVYGLLHSPDYRTRFANNLTKQLPRIPAVKKFDDFKAFAKAGRELGDLHVDYENAKQYPTSFKGGDLFLVDGVPPPPEGTNPKDFYRVEKMKFEGKRPNLDTTQVIYNDYITITDIPEDAYKYQVNGKSALAWVMERQAVTTDKASGIKNDANDYANETMKDPAYPLKLFQRIITVSLETQRIIAALPNLDID